MEKKIKRYVPLFEMAFPKKEVIEFVKGIQHTINTHLFKLLLFSNEKELLKKWKKEIAQRLVEIQEHKCKPNNMYLTPEQYFQYLYSWPLDVSEEKSKGDEDNFRLYVNSVIGDNKKIKSLYDDDDFPFTEFNNKIVNFYKRISSLLSRGKITKDVVKLYIDELILEK